MSASSVAAGPTPPPNHGPAQYELGVDYMLGRGVAADLGMAAASFLNAADTNEPRGLYAAGMMYLKGLGVTANAETAMGLLQKSAASGHAPARKVLDALSQGKDVAAYPIVVAETASAAKGADVARAPANPVTPARVLAIVVAALVVVGGGGGGYWAWSKQQADKQAALVAEQARSAEEQRKRAEDVQRVAEAERQRLAAEAQAATEKASVALREVEAEKQKIADQQAAIAAQAEALRQREEAQQAQASRPAEPVAAAARTSDDWPAMLKSAMPHVRTMMDAALANGPETVVRASAAIRALPQPTRGDRKQARALNQEGLAALQREDTARAISSLTGAVAADPGDEEVATNLGYALVKAGRATDAQTALLRALYLNPGRSSAWYNLGLAYVAENKEQAAYAAFLLTFQFAGSQQKSRDWFERVAHDDTQSPLLRRLAQRLLASPAVVAAAPSPTPTAATAQVQTVAAVAPAVPTTSTVAVASGGKSPLQQFCGEKGNPISRSLCESRECKKPENRSDPYCADFFKRTKTD